MAAVPRLRETALGVITCVVLLCYVLYIPGSSGVGWATCVLAFSVGVRWLQASRPAQGRMRTGLRLLGAGFLTWSVAQLGWLTGLGTVATVTFNAAALLMASGAAWMAAGRRLGSIRAALDGSITAASLFLIGWVTALGPLYHAGGGGPAAFIAAAYPLGDVLIASITLLMLYEARGGRRRPLALASVGLLFVFAADTAYAWQSFAGTYAPGGLADLGWFAGFAAAGIGAPRPAEIGGTTSMVTDGRSWDFLPYVPFGAALGAGVISFVARHGQVDPTQFLLMVLLTVLIMVRQLLSLGDNRRLNQRLAEAVDDLRHRAYHDPLTGLPNRAMLLDTLERWLATGSPAALLYVDLDSFKPVNDTHGHDAGDRVLVTVASRLAGVVAGPCLVARLGGDEFALLVPPASADAVAAAAIAAIGEPVSVRGTTVTIGASVGIAVHGTGAGELMRRADVAMYRAKVHGRNQAVTFSAELEPMAV